MRLYKLVSPERFDVLRDKRIRFTQPTALNDPFEARPLFRMIRSKASARQLLAERGALLGAASGFGDIVDAIDPPVLRRLLRWAPRWLTDKLAIQIGLDVFEWLEQEVLTDELRVKLGTALSAGIGILSLTEVCDDILMWSHYGAEHRGFAIEVDAERLDATFAAHRGARPAQPDPQWYRVRQVWYPAEPRVYSMQFDDDWADLFCIKAPRWAYEREWRIVASLDRASVCVGGAQAAIHLFPFPASCVTGLVLGAKMSNEDRRSLLGIVDGDRDLHHLRLRQVVLENDERGQRLGLESVQRGTEIGE